jgi:hypothetical protein
VVISDDTGINGDRITNDAQVKVTLSLGNDLILATGETLQVSANGTDWVVTTGSNKAWETQDNAVTLIAGTGNTLTARVTDIAGNVTALTLSDNGKGFTSCQDKIITQGQSNFNLSIISNTITIYTRVITYNHGVCAC